MENTARLCPVAVKCLVPTLRWPQLHCCLATSRGRPACSRRAPTHRRNPRPRRLGTLEVSAVGLGVQNMSRTYQQTIPTRSEMFNIIRTAFDRGVTFYDAAEAYGPHEVERILGEGVAAFRTRVAIATKFGWNIDLETGERRPGLNSRPEHIKRVVEGMLKRLRTDESVQELMNLTRNKHRFYQQGIQATTLIRSSRPLSHPLRPLSTQKNERKRDILVVKTEFLPLHLPQSSPSSANW
jgi:hypothetical protein